jgi:ABC-type dipeptide/oligopeptide/nickel transport system permease subunit
MSTATAAPDVRPVAGISLWQDAFRRLRRERLAVVCFAIVCLYALVALMAALGQAVNELHHAGHLSDAVKHLADRFLFADYDVPSEARGAPPSAEHWFGTDVLGRDVLSRIANGSKIALGLGLAVGVIAVTIGATLGAIAGWFGKWVDEAIVWLYSTVSSIPDIMLMMGIAFVLQRGFTSMLIAMGFTYWVSVCRVTRGEFLKVKERDYVLAARATGMSNARIMVQHVTPNVMHMQIIMFSLLFVEAIKAEVVLSFLGVGIENEPSWGLTIQAAESELMRGIWWQITFTSLALFGIVLALQVFTDALRDALDPRLRH